MNEEQAKAWVKDKTNQNKVVAAFFQKYKPVPSKLAVFMAGIPGAGKTEFVSNSEATAITKAVIIEHDKLVELIPGYTPETYYNFRKAGSVLVTRIFEECLRNGFSFVFDGTLSHEKGYRNIQKSLKRNYRVLIIYVHQDAQSAWKLTQDRELVKKRAIGKQGFITTCSFINANLLKIFTDFQTHAEFTFWIIKKNGAPGLENSQLVAYNYAEKRSEKAAVESILSTEYTIEELKG